MALTEKIELLGKGLYKNIPDTLTLKNIPTASELEYVGAEDFDEVMLTKILPAVIEENINPKDLLEIDYQWILRCLRLLNYGPYHTVNSIFCSECGPQYGEYRVNLNTVECKALPDDFRNKLVIKKDEFIEFEDDIELHMLTINQSLEAMKDSQFKLSSGRTNRPLARMCYMINRIGAETKLTSIDVNNIIKTKMSSADYMILKARVEDLTDYGLRAGGTCNCPKCNKPGAAYMALVDEKFFRPALADLREWKRDRAKR